MGNIIMVFACEPDAGADAWSQVASEFFLKLIEKANIITGVVHLPDALEHISIGVNGEVVSKTNKRFSLEHINWNDTCEDVDSPKRTKTIRLSVKGQKPLFKLSKELVNKRVDSTLNQMNKDVEEETSDILTE